MKTGVPTVLRHTLSIAPDRTSPAALHSLSDSLPHSAAPSEVDANDCGVRSSMLRSLLASACSAAVHKLSQRLLSAIDVRAALQNDKLGMFQSRERFPDVVTCREGVKAAEAGLQDLLPRLSRQIGVPCLQYVSIQNQGDFLVELPSDFRGSLPNWEKVCSTKKVNRYHPPEVKLGISRLEQARDRLEKAGSVAWAGFISEFSADYCSCRAAVQALAALDVLQGFAVLAQSSNYCRPQFVGPADVPMLSIRNGRHPVLDGLLGDGAVPNDVLLGGQGPCSAIVTGPNMGGKSCYIKQAALTVVMAQKPARLRIRPGFARHGTRGFPPGKLPSAQTQQVQRKCCAC
ncbi:unnamed protein product [Ostreobium quekettii]|uniref:DNA mismatch repair protein MutS core domain-containing protein n=1 Tax=Ostreobium quekettii TaxID=121088 RepID=A0A8S1IVN6_9CHLO|nr:unnamed protein product [Ostreobium quekettii]